MAERFEVFVPALNGFLIRNPEAVFGQVKLGTFVVSQRVIGQQIHLPNPGKVFRQTRNAPEMLRRIIDAGNHRTAEDDFRSAVMEQLQVLQDKAIIFSCPVTMKTGICDFPVIKEKTDMRQDSPERIRGSKAAGFHCDMDVFTAQKGSERKRKIRLLQRLSAGEGDTAVAAEEGAVRKDPGQHILGRHFRSADPAGFRRADRNALTAAFATGRIIFPAWAAGTGRADGAGSAMNTTGRKHHDLGTAVLGFRIVAPLAVQRTAFKEYTGADSRTVIDGEGDDIRNHAVHSQYRARESISAWVPLSRLTKRALNPPTRTNRFL